MGKMIDAQSIVVASTATNLVRHEAPSFVTCLRIPSYWPVLSASS